MTTPSTQALLVHVSFKTGTQSGLDEDSTQEICESKNATDKGLKASVRYIAREAYEPIIRLKSEFKKKIERITTPYGIKSVYLAKPSAVAKIIALREQYLPAFEVLKAGHLLERLRPEEGQEIRPLKSEEHPDGVPREEATWLEITMSDTGSAFKPERFPTREQLAASCSWTLEIMPIPESDLLRKIKDLDSTIIDELMKSNEARVKEMFAKTKAEGYARMMKPLQHMIEVLSSTEKPKIYESLVGNMADVVDSIGDLNMDDDPTLNQFATEAKALLASIDLKALKADPIIRQETASKAAAILASFGAVGKRRFA